MAIGDGSTWDESNPTDATLAVQIDDYNRDLRVGTRLRMANEHEWPSSGVVSTMGMHKYITLQPQASKPTVSGTQQAAVYLNTSNALVFENSSGATFVISNPVPSGGIIMYSGSVSAATALSPYWYVCNGSNSTPDLRDRFILCAGTTYSAGTTGGSMTHTLTVAELPPISYPAFSGVDGAPSTPGGQYLVTAGTTGGGTAFSIAPAYYVLAFIMKA